jgi:tetratricopeptide (TPR) repeat protein
MEVTLSVPALGTAAATLGALLLADLATGSRAARKPGRGALAITVIAVAAVVVAWTTLCMPRVLRHTRSLVTASLLQSELAARGPTPRTGRLVDEIARQYRTACRAVPCDDACHREAAYWFLAMYASGRKESGQEALAMAERAVALNPVGAANHALLGRARMAMGDAGGAADAFLRAVERYPSLPMAWFQYARACVADDNRGDARGALATVARLLPRQFHRRNRVLGSPAEIRAFCGEFMDVGGSTALLDFGLELGRAMDPIRVGAGADASAKVAALTDGIRGARELAHGWDAQQPAERDRRLWDLTAPRLWEWAVRLRLRDLGTPPGPRD